MKIKQPDRTTRYPDEFNYLREKYPHIAFNHKHWDGTPNDRARGCRHLYATEGYITIPENYDVEMIKQYDTFITPNSKFAAMHPELNIVVTSGPMRTDDFFEFWPSELPSYEDRIPGIASFLKNYNTGREGDCLHIRDAWMKEMEKYAWDWRDGPTEGAKYLFQVHAYGPTPYGSGIWFPDPGAGREARAHRLFDNWKVQRQYLFCFCPEPMDGELWGWDWVTERIMNCWKTKTVPVYYGAPNIADRVPKELFIDIRDYRDRKELIKYLVTMPKCEWKEMVEAGYEYEKTCMIGNIAGIEEILSNLK